MVEKIIGLLTQRLRSQNFKLVESLLNREEELSALVKERTREIHERNLDKKEALDKLKSTQQQLIMSEKMASLVQLTAGIAHEIQNPLNFVINFSSLTQDIIDELKSEQDPAERDRLMEELALNIQKIRHYLGGNGFSAHQPRIFFPIVEGSSGYGRKNHRTAHATVT